MKRVQQIFRRGVCFFIHTIDRHYSLAFEKIVFSSVCVMDRHLLYVLFIPYSINVHWVSINRENFIHFSKEKWKDFGDLSTSVLSSLHVYLVNFAYISIMLDNFCFLAPKKRKIVGKVDYEVRKQQFSWIICRFWRSTKMAAISFWSAIFILLGNRFAAFG